MSKKHNQRTRAQILAKRQTPIIEIPVLKNVGTALAPLWKTQPTHTQRLRALFDQARLPHFGAKQRAKLRAQLTR